MSTRSPWLACRAEAAARRSITWKGGTFARAATRIRSFMPAILPRAARPPGPALPARRGPIAADYRGVVDGPGPAEALWSVSNPDLHATRGHPHDTHLKL
ncbi:hypothetical protein GCM10027596_05590 [Nocardioides korecus]